MPNRIQVGGISIDTLRRVEVLDRLFAVIAARLPTQVVTVNPEFVVQAQHDAKFREVLNDAGLSIPDGAGIRLAASYARLPAPRWQPARFVASIVQGLWLGALLLVHSSRLRTPFPETVTGVDLIEGLAQHGEQLGWRFYLLGGEHGAALQAAKALRLHFPNLTILGAEEGLNRKEFSDQARRTALAQRIGQLRPDVLLVAFGAPKQDLFIAEQRKRLNVPVMMGVGGAFDFIAGSVRRAPSWLRSIGLEWLWRFVNQPWRWHRIWNAVVVFPWLIFWNRQRALSEHHRLDYRRLGA